MKKIIGLWLLAFSLAQAQTKVTIELPKSVVTEARLKQAVDSTAKATEKKFKAYADSIARGGGGNTKPVVLPDCKRGPSISRVFDVTKSGLTLQFDAEEVYSINYKIFSSENLPLYSDSLVNLVSNTVPVRLPSLADGSYIIEISGRSCVSKKAPRATFLVKTVGEVVIPAPSLGVTIPKRLNVPLPQNMNIQVKKVNDQWIISDLAERGPPNGYDFWYGINGQIIKQKSPLKNFSWPSNTPLGIWKAQAKENLSTLAKWTPDNADNDWSDSKAGATFDYNDSFPFAAYLFEKNGSGCDTTRLVTHWMDVMPDMKAPPGNVWIMPIGPIDTPENLTRKGVTHFSKYSASGKSYEGELISAGRLYDEVPQTAQQLDLSDRGPLASKWVPVGKGWPDIWNERFFGIQAPGQREPGSYEKGYQAGLKYTTAYPIVIFENTEQDHALSAHWPIFKGFYDAFMPRMKAYWNARGVEPLVAHNYFTTFSNGELTLGFASRQANKDIFRKPFSQWNAADLREGGNLEKTTAVCFGIYLGSPDQSTEVAYRLIFAAEIAKIAGKSLITFAQPGQHEWRPNNLQRQTFPEGDFYMPVKLPWNPADGITYSFLAQCFGKGLIPFTAAGKTEKKFAYDRNWHGVGSLWLPKGAKEYQHNSDQFPYWVNGGSESYQGGQAEYYIAEGVRLLNDTWLPTWGGDRRFLRFRIDGGKWVEVANRQMDDLVDAFFDKRGFVYSQRKGSQLSVFYLNSYADSKLHKLEYEYEGNAYSMAVHSTIIHPVLHKL
ncbi:hypothetical protein [Dyadobacter sandarakinus]|uniref:Uncharacterized protein n=1 Tax=Dyadobacter sandarakinus TaxID=2747268 RepID=A0ABX7I2I0_9BACT|nr:hypothetical protein [Dyadobacter sandarakinus]QRQ99726.1 hypothetical protein HWI92_01740 [Dyadobacter sandarakinus]